MKNGSISNNNNGGSFDNIFFLCLMIQQFQQLFIIFRLMEKENKQNFIELPLHAFKKKTYPIPSFLLESKLQRTAKNLQELKKIIQSQDYVCISVISEERNIFCVKLESNDKLGIIEVKEASSKNRCIYVSLNLNSSLKKQIRPYFLMKNWKIQNKIYIEDERGAGIALLQYNFAQMDLRNFINKQQGLGSKLSHSFMRKMTKDLIENLCFYHLQQTPIMDVRPETILFQNGKWFILNGDYAVKAVNDFGSTLSRPINIKFNDKRYLSPLILQNQVKSDANIMHNPYKSDVYSLGLVFLELLTLGVIQKQQFKEILDSRRGIKEALGTFQYLFRQKFLLFGQKQMKIPNLLRQMLAQRQQNRSYIFEICFMMKFTSQLLSKILPPFQEFFKKQIIEQSISTRKKIGYNQCPIEYQGQIDVQAFQERDQLIKQGRGIIYYNGQRVFDGQWHQNLPTGKCVVQFSQLLSYEGYMQRGMLHGQGILSFNGSRISQSRWYQGLSQQKCQKLFEEEQIQCGYYVFKEQKMHSAQETLIYYHKFVQNQIKFLINLIQVSLNHKVLNVLKRFFRGMSISKIKMVGSSKNMQYYPTEFELVKFQVINEEGQRCNIELMTNKKHSFHYLHRILCQTSIKMVNVELDCTNNLEFTEQSFRELISSIKPIKSLNISGCTQISDFTLRFICHHKNCQALYSLNVDRLNITDKSLIELLFSPIMNRLQSISLGHCKKITSQSLAQFFSHTKSSSLKTINISGIQIDHHGFEKITLTHNFKNLVEFNIGMCHKISQNNIADFIKLPNIDGLQRLFLYSTTFKDSLLDLLSSNSTVLNAISMIDFSGCINFTPLGFSKLLMSENLLELKCLNLSGTEITDQLLSVLSKKSYSLHSIKELSLSCCYALTDKGIKDFLKPDSFICLKKLNLSRNNFSNDTLFVLSEVTSRQLISIDLSKCSKMNDLGVQKFLNSENVKNLKDLDLSGTGIKETSLSILTTSKYTHLLERLSLCDCRYIEEGALVQFTSSQRIASLRQLLLNNTLITQRTIESIQNNPYLVHKFVRISMNNCKNITEEMMNRLCLMNKIAIEDFKSISVLKKDPRELNESFLLHKMTDLQISKKQIAHLQKIFESDYAINLSKISLNWMPLDLCLDRMSSNFALHNIKYLNLAGSTFKESSFQDIVKSAIVKQLEYLDLSWTQCSNNVLFAMAESNHLNSLRTLKLARCHRINDKGFQKYFSTPKITTLTCLDLRSTLITNITLQSLFGSKYLKNLSTLCLRSCANIKDNAFADYFKNGNCSILKDLDLSWTKMNGQIFSYMGGSKKLNQLYTLRVSGLKNIEFQLCKFIESSSSSSLTLLQANYTQISSKIMHSIASSRFLNSLEELQIKGYNLDNLHISALSNMIRSSNTTKLKCLKITKGKNQFTDKLFNNFQQYMGKIQQLCIVGLSDVELQKWKKAFKKCTIEHNDSGIEAN